MIKCRLGLFPSCWISIVEQDIQRFAYEKTRKQSLMVGNNLVHKCLCHKYLAAHSLQSGAFCNNSCLFQIRERLYGLVSPATDGIVTADQVIESVANTKPVRWDHMKLFASYRSSEVHLSVYQVVRVKLLFLHLSAHIHRASGIL